MAKTYNGRFDMPTRGRGGILWLIGGILLFFVHPVLSVPCFVMFGRNNKKKRLADRFHLYCGVIGQRGVVPVREFRKVDQRGIMQVRADLNRMISRGYFGPEAYLDTTRDSLVIAVSDTQTEKNWADAAMDFLKSLRRDFCSTSTQTSKAEPPKPDEAAETEVKPDEHNYADELERTLNELYQLNVMIEDEAVSARIDRIGVLTADIFHAVIQRPERESDVRKFMNYYLPTTLKLLKSYDMLEDQNYQSQSIIESRKKIECVLDTLIEAFEKQLENIFKADALDIATDIDVLETMMAGDGLSGGVNMPGHEK